MLNVVLAKPTASFANTTFSMTGMVGQVNCLLLSLIAMQSNSYVVF
jgi:hypothetical protein